MLPEVKYALRVEHREHVSESVSVLLAANNKDEISGLARGE